MRINFNHNELPGDELLSAGWISCRGYVRRYAEASCSECEDYECQIANWTRRNAKQVLESARGRAKANGWRASWYGKKAMAVYAMVGLAIAATSIAIAPRQSPNGNDLLNQNGQDSTAVHAVDTSDPPKERVLVGETVAELRLNGDVRALRYEEQTMPLSKASGVWGVGLARVIESNTSAGDTLMDGVTLQNDPERWRGVVEIHKTVEGKVRVVGFVEKGSVARLLDESRAVVVCTCTISLYERALYRSRSQPQG